MRRGSVGDEDEVYCYRCSGSGEGMADGSTCPICRGSGVLKYKPNGPDPEWDYEEPDA